jgi:uncharacterized protein YukE
MTNDSILYNTPAIADAVQQIHTVHAQTDANYQHSMRILNSNPDVFGGQGSQAFTDVYNMLNNQYSAAVQTILRAAHVLGMANEGMTQTDLQMASQYHG